MIEINERLLIKANFIFIQMTYYLKNIFNSICFAIYLCLDTYYSDYSNDYGIFFYSVNNKVGPIMLNTKQ